MNKRGNRRRTFHGVRQPGVQQELRRLPHRAHEQQQRQRRQNIDVVAEEVHRLAGHIGGLTEHFIEADRLEDEEDAEDAERKPEVADAVDHERLDGRRIRFRLMIPEADEQIAGQPHALPAEEHLQEVIARHQREHGEREQRQIREEPRPAVVLVHVADGIKVHQRRHRRHDDEHDRRQRIDAQHPRSFQVAGRDPAHHRHLDRSLRRVVREPGFDEYEPRQRRGRHHETSGDHFRWPVADHAAEQAGDERAQKRQEDDCGVDHRRLSPSSC